MVQTNNMMHNGIQHPIIIEPFCRNWRSLLSYKLWMSCSTSVPAITTQCTPAPLGVQPHPQEDLLLPHLTFHHILIFIAILITWLWVSVVPPPPPLVIAWLFIGVCVGGSPHQLDGIVPPGGGPRLLVLELNTLGPLLSLGTSSLQSWARFNSNLMVELSRIYLFM